MEWYETQIIGVIAGGLIAFGANWAYRWNERRIEKKGLKAGIQAEIKVLMEFLTPEIDTIRKYRKKINSQGLTQEITFTGGFQTLFLDSNIGKLGMLDKNLIEKLTELKALLCASEVGLKFTIDLISRAKRQKGETSIVKDCLVQTENSFTRIMQLGREIIDHS